MSEDGITMTKVGGETGLATVLDSGTVGTKVGGAIGLIKKEGDALSYSSDGKAGRRFPAVDPEVSICLIS